MKLRSVLPQGPQRQIRCWERSWREFCLFELESHGLGEGILRSSFKIGFVLVIILSFFGCNWVSLTYNALTYRTTQSGEAANVVVLGSFAYVTRGEEGIEVVDIASGKRVALVSPAGGLGSIDDLSVSDHFLFALDARIPGALGVYSLENPTSPQLVSDAVAVPVEPFCGVSAAHGKVIVSGGTKEMTLRSYDERGQLESDVAVGDFGRGQPDILLSSDGEHAIVSTHTWGPYFGLTTLGLSSNPLKIQELARVELDGAGFTAGGAKPANFPIESALEGDLLLVAHSKGIAFLDVHDWSHPKLLRVLSLNIAPVNVDVLGKTAAVVGASQDPKVVLIDFQEGAEKAQVVREISLEKGTRATGVALTPSHIVVAAQDKGVFIFSR